MLLALSYVTYVFIGWFKFLLLKFLYEYWPRRLSPTWSNKLASWWLNVQSFDEVAWIQCDLRVRLRLMSTRFPATHSCPSIKSPPSRSGLMNSGLSDVCSEHWEIITFCCSYNVVYCPLKEFGFVWCLQIKWVF